MSRKEPLISDESAPYLARVINRIVDNFDITALSNEEVLEVWTMLARLMGALWRAHAELLSTFFQVLHERGWDPNSDDPEDSGNGTR